MRTNLIARTTVAALLTIGTCVIITAPAAHAGPGKYQCGWGFTSTSFGVPEVKPPYINIKGRAECDLTPRAHHVTLFATFRPLGSDSWESTRLNLSKDEEDQIPAPWANYGGSITCYAGRWHSLVSITGTSGEGVDFEFSDVSGDIDVTEGECARRP